MKFFKKGFFEVYKPVYLLAIIFGVLIDLGTKYWVVQNYSYQNSECYMGEFFCMTLTFNTGFIFGINQNSFIISIFTTATAILFLIGYRWFNHDLGSSWGWNLVMVGAFGNFIDKFFIKMPPGGGVKFGLTPIENGQYIGVVDFLDFDWPDFLIFHRWPAFNFADSCISVGLVVLIITMHIDEKRKEKEAQDKKAMVQN
ncbi:MAG: lipoprotein signal peptidase [Leptospiraceae bacterium]|nr:lipoprotein signal peptidase [Leptospiraceae bacterium]MCP5512090.1 lipoprotein signal peptidase [Leptospiraceae bacterium]